MRPPPLKQRPWFIGLLSSLVVDKQLSSVGLAPGKIFDRAGYQKLAPVIPEGRDLFFSVERTDVDIPCARGAEQLTNGARLYTPNELMDGVSTSGSTRHLLLQPYDEHVFESLFWRWTTGCGRW